MKTKTPFQSWFGASKVVDSDGQPLLVFHGTYADEFKTFDAEERCVRWDGKEVKFKTFYFTDSREVAATYGNNTVEVHLSLKKPKRLDARGKTWEEFSLFGKIVEASLAGHDGLIAKNIMDDAADDGAGHISSTIYVAFNPEQIRIADSHNADIDSSQPRAKR